MDDASRKKRLSFAIFWAMWARDVTPPRLAKIINRSPDTVRRWRDGDTAPSALDVAPLARALGLRPEYFTNPPDVPAYPFEDFTVADFDAAALLGEARGSGVKEGVRRGQKGRADRANGTRPQSPEPLVRDSEAERG